MSWGDKMTYKEYYRLNREKILARSKLWRKKNPDKVRKYQSDLEKYKMVKRCYRHSITKDIFKEMIKQCNNRCSICGILFTMEKQSNSPHIDHDHKTKRVRGILCSKCNTAIGFFNDDISVLDSAISYLKNTASTDWRSPGKISKIDGQNYGAVLLRGSK